MSYIPTHWVRCETCGWANGSWDEARTRRSGEVHSEILKPGHQVTNGPRIYSTALDGTGIRREPDVASVVELEKAGRKVFTTRKEASDE